MKRRRVPSTVAEAVEMADKFVKQGVESEVQWANDTTPVVQAAVESEVAPLSANLEKAFEEVANAKAELDALHAKTELDDKEHIVASANVREERQDEVEAWKVTTSRSEATLAKVRDETSDDVEKLPFEWDSAAARH